jgi:hypothetical protein
MAIVVNKRVFRFLCGPEHVRVGQIAMVVPMLFRFFRSKSKRFLKLGGFLLHLSFCKND